MTAQPPYQVMPPLADAEYEALKASIAAGYDPARPVVVDEHGAVLDGHHRQRVCAELGITPPAVTLPGLTEDQKHDYALRANLACRHLTQLQKRDLIRAELARNPGRSDREIGRLCGADHKTIGAVRHAGEFPQLARQQRLAEQLAATAAELLDTGDEAADAERADAVQLAHSWQRKWAELLTLLLRLCWDWTPEVAAESGGYATCWDWLQNKWSHAWDRFVSNIRTLRAMDSDTARYCQIDPSRCGPDPDDAAEWLQGIAPLTHAERAALVELIDSGQFAAACAEAERAR